MEVLDAITRHLLRFSPDALIVVDAGGVIRYANETVTELFGYPPAELLGQPLTLLVPERLRKSHVQHIARYFQTPDNREMGTRTTDPVALRRNGSEFAAAIRLAPIVVDGKSFTVAAIRDATEHRQINEALIAAREDADRANRAKSRFLATASHDLRQPLQTIRLLNAAMLKAVPQSDLRELLQQQETAIESMTRLLNALLDIGRLESGAVQPTITEVALSEVLEELRSEFASIARTRQIGLRFQATDLVISADRTLFYQLLQNLLGNALKYTDHGTVDILCTQDADALTISVEDTGIGIPEDKLDRIFEEYYQIDTHGAKRVGVGLGLTIVKEVARLLGFSVCISSKVGAGTQARVHVPNRHVVTCPAAVDGTLAATSSSQVPRLARLLLVEDNEGVRLATELFLKFEGYETLSARCVDEALALFADLRPGDVIIADYHLDGRVTGLEMLLALRERCSFDVPGIILSGDLSSVLRSVNATTPLCRFLSKPVDTAVLLDAIQMFGNRAAPAAEHPAPGGFPAA